jgi:hypothetical protein
MKVVAAQGFSFTKVVAGQRFSAQLVMINFDRLTNIA